MRDDPIQTALPPEHSEDKRVQKRPIALGKRSRLNRSLFNDPIQGPLPASESIQNRKSRLAGVGEFDFRFSIFDFRFYFRCKYSKSQWIDN